MTDYRVELTRGAADDLESLYAYLVRTGAPEAADRLLTALLDAVESLEAFPDRGSVPPELDTLGIRAFRQLLRPPYRIIYRVLGERVIILVIADGRSDMRSVLEQRVLRG
jgi:toxin ParE1/3/4